MSEAVLTGRRALVTGGSRGIGRATALTLARAGADVVTCHRQPGPHVDSLRAELAELPGKHLVLAADVSRADAVTALVDRCRAHLGGLDIVVNNAGDFAPRPYAELGAADWDASVAGNLTATHQVTHAALPLLVPGASIVNLGSTVTFIGMRGGVHYTAVKAALVGYTRSLARELGPDGVRVNVVSPGRIATEALDALPPKVAQRQRETFAGYTALKRLGTVDEVARVVLFLCSPAAAYVTGQNIHVDGCV